jgi:diguanylate cyclase (GGDEF)-like protein/PAS domain S-box-containing protein
LIKLKRKLKACALELSSSRESEEKYRSLVENAHIGVFRSEARLHGRFTYLNSAMVKFFGYDSEAEMMKVRSAWLYQEPKQRQVFFRKLGEKGFVRNQELRLKRKDGSLLWGLVSAKVHSGPRSKAKWIEGYIEDITKRIKAEEELDKVKKLNKEILKANTQLKKLAFRDSHTGLFSHRLLAKTIENEFSRAKRSGLPLSVLMLDVDYFKSINDVYGHSFGDIVLKQLATGLKKAVRKYDVIIRYGGEEFIIISPGTDRAKAVWLGNRLLNVIHTGKFGDEQNKVSLKVSIAVASHPEDGAKKGSALVELSDKILAGVKEFGGDRVYSMYDLKSSGEPGVSEAESPLEVQSLKNKLERLFKRANQSLIEAIFSFAKKINTQSKYFSSHIEGVVCYTAKICKALLLPDAETDKICQAAVLYGLGKVGIRQEMLDRKEKWESRDHEEYKKHLQITVEIIKSIPILNNLIPFVMFHQEQWNGKGYPKGLKKDKIPIGARIIAVADAYKALISNRPQRKAYGKEEAKKILLADSGTKFDPRIVEALLDILNKEEKNKEDK